MKLKTKTVTVYTADDGSEHTDHMSAVVTDLFVMFKSASDDQPMDASQAATIVFNNRTKLSALFKSYNKISAQKSLLRNFEEPNDDQGGV